MGYTVAYGCAAYTAYSALALGWSRNSNVIIHFALPLSVICKTIKLVNAQSNHQYHIRAQMLGSVSGKTQTLDVCLQVSDRNADKENSVHFTLFIYLFISIFIHNVEKWFCYTLLCAMYMLHRLIWINAQHTHQQYAWARAFVLQCKAQVAHTSAQNLVHFISLEIGVHVLRVWVYWQITTVKVNGKHHW